jgi:magnesium transporter
VKNFFLENDDGDDEKRPYLWFWLQNTVTGLILALVVYLCGQLVATAAFTDITVWKAQLFISCFNVAALVTLLSSMSSVIYLKVLYWCDEHDKAVSGTAMQLTSVLISAVLFSALAVLAIVSIMGA